jgi:hypothetical protein
MMACFSVSRTGDGLTVSVTEEQVVKLTEGLILTTCQEGEGVVYERQTTTVLLVFEDSEIAYDRCKTGKTKVEIYT